LLCSAEVDATLITRAETAEPTVRTSEQSLLERDNGIESL
jgi:hypothetical protein